VKPAWYLQTAGVRPNQDYAWFPLDPAGDPDAPVSVMYMELAGGQLLRLTSPRMPSIVLARVADGGYVLVASRLEVPGAPDQGDYQNRPIRATLLGVAPPGADLDPIVSAAVAAFAGELGAALPVRWTDGTPAIDLGAGRWPVPTSLPASSGAPLPVDGSIGLPAGAMPAVAGALAALSPGDLAAFPRDRVIALHTDTLGVDDLAQLRPWRAVSSELKEQVTFPRDRKSARTAAVRRPGAAAGAVVLAVLVVGLLVWWLGR